MENYGSLQSELENKTINNDLKFVEDNQFFIVYGWMRKCLNMTKIEREIYAIIYKHTSDQGYFNGSLRYLMEWSESAERTVIYSLQSLVDKKYISKETDYLNGRKNVKYRICEVEGVPQTKTNCIKKENRNINNDNYVLLQGWMINELGLKDIEVTVYAVIFGASHNEGQYYDGNIDYISEWLSVDNDTVLRTIKSLIEKGLIGVNSCYDSRGKHNIYYVKNILGRKQ